MIRIKTEKELVHIRAACSVVAKVLSSLKGEIKPGITTRELDAFAEKQIVTLGALPAFKGYRGYKHATCLSVNEEVVHGIPGNKVLKDGDIIGVDAGAIVAGFYGDAAITFPVGKIDKKTEKLLRATKKALSLAIRQARAGKYLGDVSAAIEQHALKFGYRVVRDLYGHGIGSDLHEDPLIPNFGKAGQGPQLKKGMVLAIEPMFNLGGYKIETLKDGWTVVTADRSLSAHFEHTILITDGDPEILTEIKD
ncbi:MAG: type I methionyl aminopeptidase [Candidatus Margulisbacteria bacterium]|nr:type I methionyl aminopeptidase [Candidatus Margulisiibacteriota bacterium]MBU1022086.1 type I methionyl aminopeptidase [Candidatus Margulisiibacteriota bacterium]MBU1729681.1 type I methionyl aminopeptidase [Candidatus Margulisiibacteriota bacterium]MBU1955001.1 type I methionyl aminopeptidase [Candidatus Margulisiibacteriota bacterium]